MRFQHRYEARTRSKLDTHQWEHDLPAEPLRLRDWLQFLLTIGLIIGLIHTLIQGLSS